MSLVGLTLLYWATWLLLGAEESAEDPGRLDMQLLCVMYEMYWVGGVRGGVAAPFNVWEPHKTYYRRAIKTANSVQI